MFILSKLCNATKWSYAGLKYAIQNELAFRMELVVVAILGPVACYIADNLMQLLWLITSLFLVLIVELLNTAIEATVNRISRDHHELSMRAKDLGSAAVFCTITLALIIWGTIITERLFN